MRTHGFAVAMGLALLAASPAGAACTANLIAELPVTMTARRPMVDVKINGQPARFMADSGAFFSVMTPGAAQTYHLPLSATANELRIIGVGGSAEAKVATVDTLNMAGVDLHHVQFLVAGSESAGAGVLGQNLFGIADVEYDLPHSMIRIMKSAGCGRASLAYWAAPSATSIIKIDFRTPQRPHTIGTIQVNGKPVEAMFDTGASTSVMSLKTAARLGIKLDGPGVVKAGMMSGFGSRAVQTWIAPVDSLVIGDGEQIKNARILIGDIGVDADILIGADFFIAHRIYVDNENQRLFITYEGGPVFNLKARLEGAEEAAQPPKELPKAPMGPLEEAKSASRDAGVALARNDLDGAIALFTKAIALAPGESAYLTDRAQVYMRQRKPALALADFDAAIKLKPDDTDALLGRSILSLRQRDWPAASADLDVIDHTLDPAAMERLELGSLMTEAGDPKRAIGVLDQWIKAHPDDVRRPSALNARCWARALGGLDLDAGLRDCDAALRGQPGAAGILDSRGLIQLRKGDLTKAMADYSEALSKQPRLPWSLYGRGIIKLRTNDKAGGEADIAAAQKIRPDIADEAKRFGVTP